MRSLAPSFLYVVDASLHVVLAGTSPADLAEPLVDGTRLPAEIQLPVAELVGTHDFDREPIACATGPADIALRCIRTAGPAGSFYMLMAQPLRAVATAVA